MNSQDKILCFLQENNIDHDVNVSLSIFSYFKTGGIAKLLIYPDNLEKLTTVCREFLHQKFIFKVVGDTTNLLFLDNTDYTCIICVKYISCLHIDCSSNKIVAECGVSLPFLSRFALLNSLDGFSGLEGIPGLIGAAVFMNAGAYGDEIADTLHSVDVLNNDGTISNMLCSDLSLKYRNSIFKESPSNWIILKAYFHCVKGDPSIIYKKMSLCHAKRHKYQEFCYPTLGSLFSGSVYRELSKKSIAFGLISSIYFLFNYKIRLHRRESPSHRSWLNRLAIRIFKIKYDVQSFSDKDLNTLINQGQGTTEILRYIDQLMILLGDDVVIENEIVEQF